MNKSDFSQILLQWYRLHARPLPWRESSDPYKIWVSEIILQQTRVAQGMDYYLRFTHRFPDVTTLSCADEAEVLKYWQGLGYYSRARNLHQASRQIVALGKFPDTYDAIRSLKGVGDYTAAAIASFAFSLPHAVVDGNVYRVLSRYMGIDTPIDTAAGKKQFAQLAAALLDKANPADYNQAVMDFGALQCVPQNPRCAHCPLHTSCKAYRENRVGDLPVKKGKVQLRSRYFTFIYLESRGRVAFWRRASGDIWEGLYQPLLFEWNNSLPSDEAVAARVSEFLFEANPLKFNRMQFRQLGKDVRQRLSHQDLHARFYLLQANDISLPLSCASQAVWVDIPAADRLAFPKMLAEKLPLLSKHE